MWLGSQDISTKECTGADLQDVLVWPQHKSVIAEHDCDILQGGQVAAAGVHSPQIAVRDICQPCDILQAAPVM